ncbi:MAG: cyclic nucleotide-binding domain-containing protein [Elusimicrobia bacterium]|nr:cyclic nucleotide-binding domain-containing protein [Elusimicrobiota bacterium]
MRKLKVGDAEIGILAHMLHKVDFFSPLTVGQMEQVLPYILVEAFDAGETVFKQGAPGDAFYIIYTGQVEVWFKKGFFSLSKIVATMNPGDFFGEMALISRDPRSATVACVEATQLFVLVAADFQFVLKQNPQAAAEMDRIAARRKFNTSHLPES